MKTSPPEKRKHSKVWKRAAQMPPLYHKLPDEEFDFDRSQVVRWLVEQREIREQIFNWCNSTGAIVFRDGRWHGAENNENIR
jgi:hypothetical protein